MAVKKLKPTNNGSRNTILIDYSKILTKSKPQKNLLKLIKKKSGRDKTGQISMRHQGKRQKRFYRKIDFKRDKINIIGKISTIEYDPNRNCFISLIIYPDGEKRYILYPKNLKVGDSVVSAESNVEIKPGNSMPLYQIPEGTQIHNIELRPHQGGKLARSAGSYAKILGLDDTERYIIIKLSSSETRKILKNCRATIGVVGNEDLRLVRLGKAGRNRWRGIRPSVRGKAMNVCDHPHGGGEGKAKIGKPSPYTKWGKKARGVKTRNKKKHSTKLIIRTRKYKK